MHTSQQKLTVEIIASSTDTAKAAPQAKGSVRYNSVSGSSSSSGSKNPTLLSTTSSVQGRKCRKMFGLQILVPKTLDVKKSYVDDIWKILYTFLSIQEPNINDKWGFHLYLSKLTFNNQFYSRMTSLVRELRANNQFRNYFTISSTYFVI